MKKRRYWNGVAHPAPYSTVLLPIFADLLESILPPTGAGRVLDPFAGTGRIHELREHGFDTVGVELEPEWAQLGDGYTIVGDATALPFPEESFDAICTSPCYGNRMADHYNASDPEKRRSYKFDLGRDLSENNAGKLQWGGEYRALHRDAWGEALRVLRPGGSFVLNCKDHMRGPDRQYVCAWHLSHLEEIRGLRLRTAEEVGTPGMRAGEHRDRILPTEMVYLFTKEAA